jgi:hypothetical protein
MNGQPAQFTADEWQTLQFAPFWVFSGLIGAYRNIDPLEYDAFWRCLEAAATAPGQLSQEVIAAITEQRDRITQLYESDGRTIARGLYAVSVILRKTPLEEAELFKDMLISRIGMGVAMARGRYGRIASEDDEKTVTLVAQFLG